MDTDALKQAAIDAWMRSEGFSVESDGSYEKDQNTFIDSDGTGTVTYVFGYGSHVVVESHDLDLGDRWAQVRARVDAALEDWQEDRLPAPGDLNAGMLRAKAAVTALNIGDATSFGGALGGYFRTISESAPQLRGLAMDAFNNSFVNQLPAVISNHGCLAAIVTEAWSAEKEIWTQARADRDTLVEKTTKSLDEYAHRDSPSPISFALKLTGAAIAGASAIATGGVTLPFALATVGITSLSAINDHANELEVDRSGTSYEDLMTAFESGLADIDEAITIQEGLVKEGLKNGWTLFEANRPLFDLTPRVSDDGDGDWADETSLFDVADASDHAIVLPAQAVIDSLASGLNNLAHGLGDAAPEIVEGADDRNLLGPSARGVGKRYNGAAIWMWIVGDNNSSSIRDLQWDTREVNRMLEATIRDLQDVDAASQAHLDGLRLQLAGGSGEDPWA